MKTVIVAGTWQEARNYLTFNNLPMHDWSYLKTKNSDVVLRSFTADTKLIFVGTYKQRPDYRDILIAIRLYNFDISFGKKCLLPQFVS